nr:hypothetical protein [Tanacetum cinerariifolium]
MVQGKQSADAFDENTQDWGKFTWGGQARIFGTVLVVLGVQEARMGCWVKMAGKGVRGYSLGRWGLGEAATEKVSDDTEEMETVLTSMDAATVLASRIDAQIARELKEKLERENQRRSEQIARDEEIARIHAEEELKIMIDGLDRSNEEQIEGGVSKISEGEAVWLKRKGIRSKQESAKKQKISEEVPKEVKSSNEVPEEKIREMMQLHLDRDDLNQLWSLVKETLSKRSATSDKEMELWVDLNRLYEPDEEDQLVHHVAAKDKEIFMLVEKDYPLRKGLALVMICYKLQVENFSQMSLLLHKEMATVLTSMDTTTVLASGVAEVFTGSGSIPTTGPPTAKVPTGSDVVPTVGPIFATATVIDAQVARKLEEQMARDDQRMSEQVARDAEIARIHAEEELQIVIDGLDMSNKISQQRKPWSKKQKRDYYMAVIKSNLGWKIENFIPMGSKEEAERFKRKGIRIEQESAKKLKTSEEVPKEVKSPDEVPEEKIKEMMQLEISPLKDTKTPVESPIPISPSSSVGPSSPVRSTTPPPDYPFDKSIFAELDNSLWIIPRPLGCKLVPEEPNESDACWSVHLRKS